MHPDWGGGLATSWHIGTTVNPLLPAGKYICFDYDIKSQFFVLFATENVQQKTGYDCHMTYTNRSREYILADD